MELKDESDESLLNVTSHIQNHSRAQLEELLAGADGMGKDDILRQTWRQDVEERIQFKKDQEKNGWSHNYIMHLCTLFCQSINVAAGSKGNRWSLITIRMGRFTIALVKYQIQHFPFNCYSSSNLHTES